MEKHFLLYLIYIAFVDIRERSYENGDRTSFWLCDLLHNIPMSLVSEESIKDAYEKLCEKVDSLGSNEWLETRMKEFYNRYPEYKPY